MLHQTLLKTVERYPEKTALVYDKLRLNYQELYTKVVGLSNGLRSIGVEKSDSIAIILPNCPEFVISFYAAATLKAIALPLNPMFKEAEINFYIKDTGASVIITDIARAELCQKVISKFDRKIELVVIDGAYPSSVSFNDLIQKDTANFEETIPYEGDVIYQYSSGSTGRPKRVSRTQKNLFHQANNCVTTLNVTASDNILCIVPLFHAYGFGECLLAATFTGATLVILEQFMQNGVAVEMPFVFRCPRVLNLIETEEITILPAVPYIYSILAATPYQTQVDFASLRACISAGNFLSKDTFDKFLHRFGIPLRQLYGCTEAGAVAINLEDDSDLQYDSIGLPMKNVEIKVMDDEGNELPAGVIGEFVIKSETLTTGYYNLPEVNKEAFQNGHFFTGDLGKKDEQGRLYLTGRKKIFIDTGGHKVDPLEVEDVLMAHPQVAEAVVVGVKGPLDGEMVKAVLVLKGDCKEQDILAFCKDKLADYKTPKFIEFRQELPKNPL
ncbi:MAG: AMP-binding protein, partial [Tolypothrix sp. T3-bin4]|nr:AMP-binding protein [Tolypothrix sp. T3-bin4]